MEQQAKKILHIAPQNIANVPMTLVRAERELGHESRLVTFFADRRAYEEDYCLHLPLVEGEAARRFKRMVSAPDRVRVDNRRRRPAHVAVWRPRGRWEKTLIVAREAIWQPKIKRMMREIDFWNYDIYEFDAGLDFYRDGRTVQRLQEMGKKIIVLYTGSDLRTRGVIAPVDTRADLRLTVEWDHLDLDPALQHVLFPFEPRRYAYRAPRMQGAIRIGHAPTNRAAKGTESILSVLSALAAMREIEIVLIENVPHAEAMRRKASCDIFVDQIGDLGYGINAIEALALGVPVCTCLVAQFARRYPDHPFQEVTGENLKAKLIELIDNAGLRRRLSRAGRKWVEKYHESTEIAKQVHALLARGRRQESDTGKRGA